MDLKDKSEDYQAGFAEYHNDMVKILRESVDYKLTYEQFYRKIINLIDVSVYRLKQTGNFN